MDGETLIRECDTGEWEINSGNSDANCFNTETQEGDGTKRNTFNACSSCPYNSLLTV